MSDRDHDPDDLAEASEPGKKLAWGDRQRHIVGGPEILSGRVRRALERHTPAGESPLFCLKGDFDHSLIALNDRLLIIKAGVFAGTTFGARVATIYYKDITGIEVNTGLLNCVVEIATPSYPSIGKKSVWFGGKTSKNDLFNRDPHTESNTIPVMRFNLKKWQPYLEQLRAVITDAKGRPAELTHAAASAPSIGTQLKELVELRDSGVLDDEEFAQAKARVLAGG
ncbi:MAG: SHOCT domain-containing protein [Gaiellaceae bacterium]